MGSEFVVDKEFYDVNDSVIVSISDPGAGMDPFKIDTIAISVKSDSQRTGISVICNETGSNTKIFRGKFKFSEKKKKGVLRVRNGDTVTIEYVSEFPADYEERWRGSRTREQFTAVGTTVNVANRLQNNAREGQILVSTPTKLRIEKYFDVRKIEAPEPLKNIHGQIEYYEVIRKRSSSSITLIS